jgi:hypothetical protein
VYEVNLRHEKSPIILIGLLRIGDLGITPVVPHILMLKLIIIVFSLGNFLFPDELNIV